MGVVIVLSRRVRVDFGFQQAEGGGDGGAGVRWRRRAEGRYWVVERGEEDTVSHVCPCFEYNFLVKCRGDATQSPPRQLLLSGTFFVILAGANIQ